LKRKHILVFNYLEKCRKKLIKRSIERNGSWFLFGRSQGIQDVFRNKVAINSLITDIKSIKLNEVQAAKRVYSELYIVYQYSKK